MGVNSHQSQQPKIHCDCGNPILYLDQQSQKANAIQLIRLWLISTMGFLTLVRHLYIESWPWALIWCWLLKLILIPCHDSNQTPVWSPNTTETRSEFEKCFTAVNLRSGRKPYFTLIDGLMQKRRNSALELRLFCIKPLKWYWYNLNCHHSTVPQKFTARLLHSPNLVAVRLSVGYETRLPIGWCSWLCDWLIQTYIGGFITCTEFWVNCIRLWAHVTSWNFHHFKKPLIFLCTSL